MNAPVRLATTPERHRLRVEEFALLCDSGAFEAHAKSELIDGDIYLMSAQFARHARIKTRLAFELGSAMRALNSELEALVEVSIRASDHDMPEPDITLTSWRGDRDVPVATVALVVEVADTTLADDLGRKLALYARAGVPEYWVVDVEGARVIVHHQPTGDGFARHAEVPFGAMLRAATIGALAIETAGLA